MIAYAMLNIAVQVIAATNRVDILDPALLRSGMILRKGVYFHDPCVIFWGFLCVFCIVVLLYTRVGLGSLCNLARSPGPQDRVPAAHRGRAGAHHPDPQPQDECQVSACGRDTLKDEEIGNAPNPILSG